MSDAPIEPHEYLYGVKVVQIEDLRVARGLTRQPGFFMPSQENGLLTKRSAASGAAIVKRRSSRLMPSCTWYRVFDGGLKDLNRRRRDRLHEADAVCNPQPCGQE
uniref:Uncharacterized protein n=1 Tax=Pseudomonas phage PACT201 TaxID=3230130 RepID=A0AAU8GSA2_9VIRU